jgi:Animal haem peroxidase
MFELFHCKINPTISNEFATAAFRFGHTLVNNYVRRFNTQRKMIEEMPLADIIFSPVEAYNQPMGGLDTLLLGLLFTPSSKFDPMFSDLLRNHLFEAGKKKQAGEPILVVLRSDDVYAHFQERPNDWIYQPSISIEDEITDYRVNARVTNRQGMYIEVYC